MLVSPTETLSTDLVPLGDDIEPSEAPREDFEMENDEDEEPLEVEVPRARMSPKNPTSRRKQEHEDSANVVHRSWCEALLKVEELVDHVELNCWMKRRGKARLRLLLLTTVS